MNNKDIYEELSFYRELKNLPVKLISQKRQAYLSTLTGGKIYKFIGFDGKCDTKRIVTINEQSLWLGSWETMNDKHEFYYPCDQDDFIDKAEEHRYECFTRMLKRAYLLCSFSYQNSEKMWEVYASNGNGVLIEFEIKNYEYLYPVEYIDDKTKYSFVDLWRKDIDTARNRGLNYYHLSLMPYLIKDEINISNGLNSKNENEVRLLYDPYEKKEINNGVLDVNKKMPSGIKKEWQKVGLSAIKGYIGRRCIYEDEIQEVFHRIGIEIAKV